MEASFKSAKTRVERTISGTGATDAGIWKQMCSALYSISENDVTLDSSMQIQLVLNYLFVCKIEMLLLVASVNIENVDLSKRVNSEIPVVSSVKHLVLSCLNNISGIVIPIMCDFYESMNKDDISRLWLISAIAEIGGEYAKDFPVSIPVDDFKILVNRE